MLRKRGRPQVAPTAVSMVRCRGAHCASEGSANQRNGQDRSLQCIFDRAPNMAVLRFMHLRRCAPGGGQGGLQGSAASGGRSDRSSWAGTCVCTSEAQGKCLVPTRWAAFVRERRTFSASPLRRFSIHFFLDFERPPPVAEEGSEEVGQALAFAQAKRRAKA